MQQHDAQRYIPRTVAAGFQAVSGRLDETPVRLDRGGAGTSGLRGRRHFEIPGGLRYIAFNQPVWCMSIQLPGKPDEEAAYLVELGRRVRHARQAAGLTRRQLAEHSGLSERYLAQLEAGEGNISVLLMRRVAKVLRTDLQRLVAEPTSRAVPL